MPTNSVARFKSPKKWYVDLEAAMLDFGRWGQQKDERKAHWICWDKLKKVKAEGGIGFGD